MNEDMPYVPPVVSSDRPLGAPMVDYDEAAMAQTRLRQLGMCEAPDSDNPEYQCPAPRRRGSIFCSKHGETDDAKLIVELSQLALNRAALISSARIERAKIVALCDHYKASDSLLAATIAEAFRNVLEPGLAERLEDGLLVPKSVGAKRPEVTS